MYIYIIYIYDIKDSVCIYIYTYTGYIKYVRYETYIDIEVDPESRIIRCGGTRSLHMWLLLLENLSPQHCRQGWQGIAIR